MNPAMIDGAVAAVAQRPMACPREGPLMNEKTIAETGQRAEDWIRRTVRIAAVQLLELHSADNVVL